MFDFGWLVKNPFTTMVGLGVLIAYFSFSTITADNAAKAERVNKFQDGIIGNMVVKDYMDKKFDVLREDVGKAPTVYEAGQVLRRFQNSFNEDFAKAFDVARVQTEMDRAIQTNDKWYAHLGAVVGCLMVLCGMIFLIKEYLAYPPIGGRT